MAYAGISTPKNLITYFKSIQGKGVLSGEFAETGDPVSATTGPLATIQSETGQCVGITGFDYYHFNTSGPAITSAADAAAIANWQAGGLDALSLSLPNPTTGGGSQDTSQLDVSGLLTPGTATNNALNASLSQVAAGLKQLQDAGVVVLFRPYHENNGNWFWWGAGNMSAQQFQALWQYTYNYMTNTMGLHNLAWVYSINSGFTLPGRSLTDTYPGNSYVDVTGQDYYGNNPADAQSTYQALSALGKPTALTEFGSGSASRGDTNFSEMTLVNQIKANMPNTVYWLQWWAGNGGDIGWGIEQDQNISAALNDPYVINRGEIAETAPPPQVSANDTIVKASSNAAITDASGDVYTLSSDNRMLVNGVEISGGEGTSKLDYYNGTVYAQDTTSGAWYTYSGGTAGTFTASSAPGNLGSPPPTPPTPTSTPVPTASPNDTVVKTGSTAAITDASGNAWTITSGGQVAVNGAADTTTATVTELAYVNGAVWQENSSGLWWEKTSPTVSWSPSAGTNTSPLPASMTASITLRVSEAAHQGDAQFIVKVDGTQVGGIMTASALHASGDSNVFVLNGNWASGSHQVAIQFLNDAYGGLASADRNLYVDSIAYNGQTGSGTSAAMNTNGTQTFTVGGSVTAASGPADTVTVRLSGDAYNGNAQFQLLVGGKVVTTPQQVVASHAAGAWQDLSFAGNFGAGNHTIGVQFTNDAYGGTASTDRNLYVNGIDVNGTHYGSGVTALMGNGTTNFAITTTH